MATAVGVSALELWTMHVNESTPLRSGCDSIDNLLDGGFRVGLLTEICGEASAGKTQLCLQLLLQCTLPRRWGGLGSTACYICTEGVGSIKRLHELAQAYADKYRPLVGKRKRDSRDISESLTSKDFLDSIFIEQLYEVDDLLDVLQTRLPKLLEEHNTKLVVIDSIAAVFRLESTTSVKEASERSRTMFQTANCMKILSAQYNVIFVMTNQVTGNFSANVTSAAFKPALGLSWSNCINQRLMIIRGADGSRRRLKVVFSPYLPQSQAIFQITSDGISDSKEDA